jgi:hypothetical protein
MPFKELQNAIIQFAELCASNPHTGSLSFEEIKERLTTFNLLNSVLIEKEKLYDFHDAKEEIEYYRHLKPEFQQYGIYYEIVYNLELKRPPLAARYYKKQLKLLNKEFKHFKSYFVYFRSEDTSKDFEYFRKDSKENHIFALVKANSMLTKYLIGKTGLQSADEIIASHPKVKWNIAENDIMELAKSFKGIGVAEGSLSDVAESLGRFFGKEMKNIYNKSHFITSRLNPAKFLEKCANWLKKAANN